MREKKAHQFKQDIINEVERLKLTFNDFSDGVRVLFLMHRNKEGGDTNNTKVEKVISRGTEEFWEIVANLIEKKNNSRVPLRVYSSVNPRNIEKAIRQFKVEQLEADYYDDEQRHQFYYDIRNRWIGCLMQPAQKNQSRFIFDVDTPDNSDALKVLANENILLSYRTKNGWHIVTEPFNHTILPSQKDVELQKDGLLLLSF